ncbi:hypothetical protein DFH28DRAFT_1108913 [Melampsora americana]|nr:hypothetical protein DFH28DRAFT_1108913 [Melampsora americana]
MLSTESNQKTTQNPNHHPSSSIQSKSELNEQNQIESTESNPSSDLIPNSSSSSSNKSKTDQEKSNQINLAFERLIKSYDLQTQTNHSNPIPKEILLRTADQLKDPNRRFVRPLPLKHVVSVLYRSWFHDGTIPEGYQFEPYQSTTTSQEESSEEEDQEEKKGIKKMTTLTDSLTLSNSQLNQSTLNSSKPQSSSLIPLKSSIPFFSSSSSFSSRLSSSTNPSFFNDVQTQFTSLNQTKLTKVYLTRI